MINKKIKKAINGGLAALVLGASALTNCAPTIISQKQKQSTTLISETQQQKEERFPFPTMKETIDCLEYTAEIIGNYQDKSNLVGFTAEVSYKNLLIDGLDVRLLAYNATNFKRVPVKTPDGKTQKYLKLKFNKRDGRYHGKVIAQDGVVYAAFVEVAVKLSKEEKRDVPRGYFPFILNATRRRPDATITATEPGRFFQYDLSWPPFYKLKKDYNGIPLTARTVEDILHESD